MLKTELPATPQMTDKQSLGNVVKQSSAVNGESSYLKGIINDHIFNNVDSPLSGLFALVTLSLDNQGSTVIRCRLLQEP